MSKGYTVAPWRPIVGTGQSLTVPIGGHVESTAVGAQTRAVALSVITGNCLVKITPGGLAASASQDFLIKTSDPPVILGCSGGDKVSAWGIAAGTLQLCEMTN